MFPIKVSRVGPAAFGIETLAFSAVAHDEKAGASLHPPAPCPVRCASAPAWRDFRAWKRRDIRLGDLKRF
jgi:hypothetical protein